jgi:hypothetical protein
MAGVIADPGELGDHHRDPLQGPQVGVEPIGQSALEQGLLDPGQLGGRQLGVRAGRATTAHGIHPTLLEPGVPGMGTLTRDAELVGALGLGAAEGEQLGRLQAPYLEGGLAKSTWSGSSSGRVTSFPHRTVSAGNGSTVHRSRSRSGTGATSASSWTQDSR